MKLLYISTILLIATVLASCKKDSGSPEEPAVKAAITATGTADGTPVTQTIGSAGGTIVSGDSSFELVIPAGALTTNTAITIQPITNEAPNGRRKAYRCSPDGLQFAQNITVKFHYTAEDAAKTKPEYMLIAFQKTDKSWQVLEPVGNDIGNRVLTVPVNHFTDFSAFDIMRIVPPELHLKTGQTGHFQISYARILSQNALKLLAELQDVVDVWKVNGVQGGNSTFGTIAQNGEYTAPAAIPSTNPVTISAEQNFSFSVNGQSFNKLVMTALAFIGGGKYGVVVDATMEMTLGTLEKFQMHDQCSFTLNLTGITGTVTNLQNSPPTYQKIADGPAGCVSSFPVAGSGIINYRPQDISVFVNQAASQVTVNMSAAGPVVNPMLYTNCPCCTPATNELPIVGVGGELIFNDSGQQQIINSGFPPITLKYTVTPIQ